MRELAADAGTGCVVRATDQIEEAIDGAEFAISSIGDSGAEATARVYGSTYHATDLQIPSKHGVQQVIGDTCGPAGMMMALRAIPAYIEICREMERRCHDVILLNHSNPMAPLCRAMRKYTGINVIGICHGVQIGIMQAAAILELPARDLDCMWIGTNHCYWFTRVLHRGRDVYPKLRQRIAEGSHRRDRCLRGKCPIAMGTHSSTLMMITSSNSIHGLHNTRARLTCRGRWLRWPSSCVRWVPRTRT